MESAAEERRGRIEIAIGVLMAVVAITAALAAWRTSMVAGQVTDNDRAGLIAASKQQAVLHIIEGDVYGQAGYAAQVAIARAEAAALRDTGRPALVARAANIEQYLVPSVEQLVGPFAADAADPTGGLQVRDRLTAALSGDADYLSDDPTPLFAAADDANRQKQALTVVSVVLAIALFWLGLAEITAGGWRLTNGVIGVALWVLGVAAFLVIEAAFASGAGGGA